MLDTVSEKRDLVILIRCAIAFENSRVRASTCYLVTFKILKDNTIERPREVFSCERIKSLEKKKKKI